MIRRFYIYLAASAALLLSAGCVKEMDVTVGPEIEQEGKVTINGSMSLPMTEASVWTKSFGEYSTETGITHLYIAVFNEGDILQEVVEARPGTKEHPTDNFTPASEGEKFKTVFHVTLTESPARKRILHFIGTSVNRPDLLQANIVDESSYAKTLKTSGREDCYWGREEYDFLNADTELTDIPLVRNFVKVKVLSEAANFEIKAFKVFNVPTSGAIAPFNPNSQEYTGSGSSLAVNFNRFADYSSPISYHQMSGSDDGQQHYEGYMPSDVAYDDLSGLLPGYNASGSTDAAFVTANFCDAGSADYLYEATHYENEKNPFIIIQGSYNGHDDTYYKADFVYPDDNGDNHPYHLLRNFQYTLNIIGVTADGASTILEAVNGVALNNFEASTQSQYLTNITDGSTRLYVSTTDELIVRGTTFKMYIKSEKLSGSTWVNDNANLSVKSMRVTGGGSAIVDSTGLSSGHPSGIEIGNTDVTYDGSSGWREVTITVKDAATLQRGEVLKQRITFKNKGADGADGTLAQKSDDLTRNLNLTVRTPLSLTVDVQDYVPGVSGSTCRVDFSIPAGLTTYRFPMTFYIEQSTNTLYPDYLSDGAFETLSVVTGKSNIPDHTSQNTYYYKRVLTWEEYRDAATDVNGIKTFSSYLKSLVGASKTDVWVFPAPENDYFVYYDSVTGKYTNVDSFDNTQTPGEITFERTGVLLSLEAGHSTSVNAATTNSGAQVSFTSSDPTVVTVGVNTGLLTAVATGTAVITASCDAYGAYTGATNTFTVRVFAEGGLDIVWKREPTRVLIPGATGSVEAKVILSASTSQTGSTIYESSNTSVATVSSDGTITAVAAGTTVITATAQAVISGIDEVFEQDIFYTLTVAAHGDIASGTVYHTETFQSGTLGDYTVNVVSKSDDLPSDKENIWYYGGELYGAEAASRNGSGGLASSWLPGESWLVSKSLDLRATDGAVIRFTHTANYFDDTSATSVLDQMKHCLTLWYSIDGGTSWTQIVIPDDQYPTGTSWASQNTNIALPAAACGQNDVRIAFKYLSDEFHGQWQVKELTISEN